MAMFVETKANENIRADANAAGDYITLTNGYIPNYLFEVGVSYTGSTINVTSGMIVQNGVKVLITTPQSINVGTEAVGTNEYKLYLKVNMATPTAPTLVAFRSNITVQQDDIFSNMQTGINHIELAIFTKGTSGVTGLSKTLTKSINLNEKIQIFNGTWNLNETKVLPYNLDDFVLISVKAASLSLDFNGSQSHSDTCWCFGQYADGNGYHVTGVLALQKTADKTYKLTTASRVTHTGGGTHQTAVNIPVNAIYGKIKFK